MSENVYDSVYNCKTREVEQDCPLKPSQITKDETPWLWAVNNKYEDAALDVSKIGKWMVFTDKEKVDALWERVKEGIQTGDLWHAKVSPVNMATKENHVIIIYTKDYEDVKDVVEVLDFLERSEIKDRDTVIKYKTDEQTYAGIYAGGKQKASIYSSSTVRQKLSPQKEKQTTLFKFFDKV